MTHSITENHKLHKAANLSFQKKVSVNFCSVKKFGSEFHKKTFLLNPAFSSGSLIGIRRISEECRQNERRPIQKKRQKRNSTELREIASENRLKHIDWGNTSRSYESKLRVKATSRRYQSNVLFWSSKFTHTSLFEPAQTAKAVRRSVCSKVLNPNNSKQFNI